MAAPNVGGAAVTTKAVYSEPDPGKDSPKISVGPWELPDVPPAGQVRVRMIRSEICNSDRRVISGTKKSDLSGQRLVLGHEGIGRVETLPSSGNSFQGLKKGDLVVVTPHFVEDGDPFLKRGLPNLSPQMKHIGFHINGVFADLMDYPAFNIFPIEGGDAILKRSKAPTAYYDRMVMIEPLACVQRGYKLLQAQDYFGRLKLKSALVLGAGPMGVIHAIHLHNKFPKLKIDLYDRDPTRQRISRNLNIAGVRILDKNGEPGSYDLVVSATSSREANTQDSVRLVRNGGVILLFSGIDMKEGEPRPFVGPVDIEMTHRREGVVDLLWHDIGGLDKRIHFLGTSGYVKADIATSIRELHRDFLLGPASPFSRVSTTVVEKLDGRRAVDLSGYFHDAEFREPALIPLLKLFDERQQGDANVHNYLKISVRHQ